jgi:hypothetical protein
MRSSDNIEKMFRLLELDTSRRVDDKILSDAGDALETVTELRRMATRGTSRWGVAFDIIKRGAIKVGMAAAVVITATSIWIVVEKVGSPCGVTPSGTRNVGQSMPTPQASVGMGGIAQPADANVKKAGSGH